MTNVKIIVKIDYNESLTDPLASDDDLDFYLTECGFSRISTGLYITDFQKNAEQTFQILRSAKKRILFKGVLIRRFNFLAIGETKNQNSFPKYKARLKLVS